MRRFIYPTGVLLTVLVSATCTGGGAGSTASASSSASSTGTSNPYDAGEDGDDGNDGEDGDVVVPPMKTWTLEKTPADVQDVTIERLWGSGPHDIYAVGGNGTVLHSKGDGVWVKQAIATGSPIADMSGSGPDDVYVAGVFACVPGGCNPDGGGWIDGGFYHSTGNGSWTRILPDYSDGFAVWMIKKDSGYVMGSKGAGDLLLHLTGPDTWVPETLPVDNVGPHAMWSSSPADVYILGQGNRVFHSKGDGVWTAQAHSWPGIFYNIWGSGPQDVYIIGPNALVFHSGGDGKWSQQTVPPIQKSPIGIWGSGPGDVYVVTGEILSTTGEILHSSGSGQWTRVEGKFPSLSTVWGSGPDDVYVAGDNGVILHLK